MDARTQSGVSTFTKLLAVLVILGAITWGLIGLFQWNLVNAFFGGDVQPAQSSRLSQFLYILVGLSGVALAFTFPWRNGGRRYAPRREVLP
ncbi:DUF378 domain-containing protein [Archangium sp.]|jgi:hypothetical protein|uniref:DUF378 domain-containing protein n=1 Tax=Archangium sp. TaxID=1872627 RepID=UPI002EDAC168